MKILNSSLLYGTVAATIIFGSCGTPDASSAPSATTTDSATSGETVRYNIDNENSSVNWTGTMVGVKSHTGILRFRQGELDLQGGQLAGGNFTVDMHSHMLTDTNYAADGSPQGTREKLIGHLMSADFFAADTFPTSNFLIKKVNGNTATGDLTVRGRTNEEQLTNITIITEGDVLHATGDLTFNRQKYGVAWKAPMKDMVLSDDIVLHIDLHATKVQ